MEATARILCLICVFCIFVMPKTTVESSDILKVGVTLGEEGGLSVVEEETPHFLQALEKFVSVSTSFAVYPSEDKLLEMLKNGKIDLAAIGLPTYLKSRSALVPLAASRNGTGWVFIAQDGSLLSQWEWPRSALPGSIIVHARNESAQYAELALKQAGIDNPALLLKVAPSNYAILTSVLNKGTNVGVLEKKYESFLAGENFQVIRALPFIPNFYLVTTKDFEKKFPTRTEKLKNFFMAWSNKTKLMKKNLQLWDFLSLNEVKSEHSLALVGRNGD